MMDSAGFSPTVTGNPAEFHYATTIFANQAVADTIPVKFDLSNDNGANEIFTMSLNATGQLAGSFSFDAATFAMTAADSQTHSVFINTIGLLPGNYVANVQISAEKHGDITVQHAALHFMIHVIGDPNARPRASSPIPADSSSPIAREISSTAAANS